MPARLERHLLRQPVRLQGPAGGRRLAPGEKDWRLLLQVDTDEQLGLMWGDCGLIYFWIREQDAAARRFDRAWVILQCS